MQFPAERAGKGGEGDYSACDEHRHRSSETTAARLRCARVGDPPAR